jgi:oxygen-independent coproporphyrinogen-3 oxidase
MLPLPLMKRVLAAADKIVSLDSAEVTVEANPGTVLGGDYLRGLRDLGVNRLSMGVQSLHDPTLKVLGRIHTAAEARTSFEDARRAGFSNVNIDFIFGLPDQSEESWRESLGQIADWGADHLSLYSLIVEQGTPLESQVAAGRVQVPDDDTTGAMYEAAMVQLDAAGYQQYEISNWARRQDSPFPITNSRPPHFACHHNLAYWLNADYLAAGAGAHGHVFPTRYSDIRGINEYIRAVRAGNLPLDERTDLDQGDLEAETMFMGLRLNAGVSFAHFEDRCGRTLDAAFGETVAELIGLGLLERDTAAVRLTERGRMLGNQVFARFV